MLPPLRPEALRRQGTTAERVFKVASDADELQTVFPEARALLRQA